MSECLALAAHRSVADTACSIASTYSRGAFGHPCVNQEHARRAQRAAKAIDGETPMLLQSLIRERLDAPTAATGSPVVDEYGVRFSYNIGVANPSDLPIMRAEFAFQGETVPVTTVAIPMQGLTVAPLEIASETTWLEKVAVGAAIGVAGLFVLSDVRRLGRSKTGDLPSARELTARGALELSAEQYHKVTQGYESTRGFHGGDESGSGDKRREN